MGVVTYDTAWSDVCMGVVTYDTALSDVCMGVVTYDTAWSDVCMGLVTYDTARSDVWMGVVTYDTAWSDVCIIAVVFTNVTFTAYVVIDCAASSGVWDMAGDVIDPTNGRVAGVVECNVDDIWAGNIVDCGVDTEVEL